MGRGGEKCFDRDVQLAQLKSLLFSETTEESSYRAAAIRHDENRAAIKGPGAAGAAGACSSSSLLYCGSSLMRQLMNASERM